MKVVNLISEQTLRAKPVVDIIKRCESVRYACASKADPEEMGGGGQRPNFSLKITKLPSHHQCRDIIGRPAKRH